MESLGRGELKDEMCRLRIEEGKGIDSGDTKRELRIQLRARPIKKGAPSLSLRMASGVALALHPGWLGWLAIERAIGQFVAANPPESADEKQFFPSTTTTTTTIHQPALRPSQWPRSAGSSLARHSVNGH